MTPRETYEFIDASVWRLDAERRLRIWQTWHTAAFVRAKRLPAYQEVLPHTPQPLTKQEKERKRAEFDELVGKIEGKWEKARR